MRGIELLHPELQKIAQAFLDDCKKEGLNVLITETFRTKTEQDALYAKGRTAPGSIVTNCKYPQSPHCWGVAFDFCRNYPGKEYDNWDGFFESVGAIGKKHGLFWGGDFRSFTDKPHLEYEKYLPNNSVKTLQGKYGTPDNFIKSWEAVKVEQEVSAWAKDAQAFVIANKISDGTRPLDNITRQEAWVMLERAVNLCLSKTGQS